MRLRRVMYLPKERILNNQVTNVHKGCKKLKMCYTEKHMTECAKRLHM